MFYIAIIVTATNDEMLLRNSDISLPFFNVTLPLFAFYGLAPMLILAFHLDLLINFEKHAKKLKRFKALKGHEELLYPFLFNYSGYFLRLLTWLTCFIFPVALLLFIQIRFLPYHHNYFDVPLLKQIEWGMTSWHKTAAMSDVVILFTYWLKIRNPGLAYLDFLKNGYSNRAEYPVRWFWVQVIANSIFLFLITLLSFSLNIPTGLTGRDSWADRFIHRNLLLEEKILVKSVPSEALLAAYHMKEGNEKKTWLEHVQGLDLRARDLRFADFKKAVLTRADFRGADLSYADLSKADLRGANMSFLDCRPEMMRDGRQTFEYCSTLFNFANFRDAKLHGANLVKAELKGVFANGAVFSGANLEGSDFSGGSLIGASFIGNDRGLKAPGADLSGATIIGDSTPIFSTYELNGTNLTDAELLIKGKTTIQGSVMFNTSFLKGHVPEYFASNFVSHTPSDEFCRDWNLLLKDYEDNAGSNDNNVIKRGQIRRLTENIKLAPHINVSTNKSDHASFSNMRRMLACKDPFVALGLIRQESNYRQFVYGIRRETYLNLAKYVKSTCPDIAQKIAGSVGEQVFIPNPFGVDRGMYSLGYRVKGADKTEWEESQRD